MKKIIKLIVIIGVIIGLAVNSTISEKSDIQKSIAGKIIRFHVLANSDSTTDQALKLKVRDKVLAFIAPKLSKSNNLDESRKLLLKYNNEIQKISQQVVIDNGYKYSVKTELNNDYFPVKSYGEITLPEGNYEAYRILIGDARGHNWWCVMFPPLCFTDITKGEVEVNKTKNEMKKVLTNEEYEAVDNSESSKKIVVKFKIEEELTELISYIKSKI